MELAINIVPATIDLMQMLEAKGIIRRIAPGCDKTQPEHGKNQVDTLYKTDPNYGGHKLIAVTVNTDRIERLTAHPDREDFLLIDSPQATPLILTIALHKQRVIESKIADASLKASDFIAIECKMNDPDLSFFTMNPEYPHTETCKWLSERPPSFYVSEPSELPEQHVSLQPYAITLREAL